MNKIIPLGFLVIVAAYLVFLAALWARIQKDSQARESAVNALLDSMPKGTASDKPSSTDGTH